MNDDDRIEWYKERRNVTYADGTPVHEGDRIRFHQAPGGILPHGDWTYGTAVVREFAIGNTTATEILLEDDQTASWGGKPLYNLYGHVIERIET